MAKHRVDSWFYSLFFLGIAVLIFFQRNNPSQSLQKMAEDTPKSVYDFTVKDIRGNDVGLGTYSGKILYGQSTVELDDSLKGRLPEKLNILYEKYKDQGFEILAFPCNQFLSQEPGTNDEIQETVCTMFKAEFPIFDKVEVNGKNAAPLYNFLKTQKGGLFGDGIKWNFTKFLVGKDGKVVERYAPTTSPLKIECCCHSSIVSYTSPAASFHPLTPSNPNSHCRRPTNSLSLPRLNPTSITRKWTDLSPRLELPYARNGDSGKPKWVFDENENRWCSISNSSTAQKRYSQILRQYAEWNNVDEMRDLYLVMKDNGLEPGVVLETMLIDIFMKSGEVPDAFHVFERMPTRNVVTWTAIIFGCVQNDFQKMGISLFLEMLESGVSPNAVTFNVVLQACTDLAAVDTGKQVHGLVVRAGFGEDSRAENCLIAFYSNCGLLDEAQKVFVRMKSPDLVSFTSMIAGFSKNGLFKPAARLFDQMLRMGLQPNEYTVTTILAACDFVLGEQIHAYMIKNLLHQSLYAASSLIDFYSKNALVEGAKLVFRELEARNVVTWSTMISCYLKNGYANKAMDLFFRMVYSGIKPNEFTLAAAVGACGFSPESICLGQQLHCLIIKMNLAMENHIFNALLTMYARNGKIVELERLFGRIQNPDIVSWSAVVSGYYQNGLCEKSASMLCFMHRNGAQPNEHGFSSALSSCAGPALLGQGRQFHGLALKLGCDFDVCVGNALVNMYAKCGDIDAASLAFDGMPMHDVMSWNTLIHGYAYHGHGMKALQVFDEMVGSGFILPNHSTFVGLLNACSHVGFVDEALRYFKAMDSHYGIEPSISHYACMVDVMGRAGRFDEAVEIIHEMPFEPDSLIWKTLLGSCRIHKNLGLGKLAAKKAIELSPQDAANYVLLSNLHATCEAWDGVERTRKMMQENGVKKDAGGSWIEIQNEVDASLNLLFGYTCGSTFRILFAIWVLKTSSGHCTSPKVERKGWRLAEVPSKATSNAILSVDPYLVDVPLLNYNSKFTSEKPFKSTNW
ncbi:hypothetical protein ACLOJK_011905 [Asimina triloba]